jgi:4-diphosphocytidyl-2C-methyl-D-erythritol kinase
MSPEELQRFIGYKSLEESTQDFCLAVAPGADVAFCIAFVLARGERNGEELRHVHVGCAHIT